MGMTVWTMLFSQLRLVLLVNGLLVSRETVVLRRWER